MAPSDVVKHKFDAGSWVFNDGTTGTALTKTVRFDNADMSLSNVRPDQRATSVYTSRAVITSIRKGDLEFAQVTFSWQMTDFTEASGTVADMILGNNTAYSARTRTTNFGGDAITLEFVCTVEGTDYGDTADHTWTIADAGDFTITSDEGEPNTFSITFTAYSPLTGGLAQ